MTSVLAQRFVSDNTAPVHPAALDAIERVNGGPALAYGHDDYTGRIERAIAEQFAPGARAFLVWGGSGANVLCLRAVCRRWEGVICAETAHLNVDECGAPEAIAGVKLLTAATGDGKLTPELIDTRLTRLGDEHRVQPRLVSVSQCTELGTVYSAEELGALAEHAHAHGLLVHVDGARLTNAAAALGCSLAAITTEVGVDVVSFGGTKAGLLGAEAVVCADPRPAAHFAYLRKQSMQLASKMRYLAAQFEALLGDELWRRCATNANAMARLLTDAVGTLDGIEITQPVQSNAVFARVPPGVAQAMPHHLWDERTGEVRWMCAWDTSAAEVQEFADVLANLLRTC